jgi:selenocysteine-specific elongation factor
MPSELRVVATAGHVDHGKSTLIERLTGIDPDRWAEEKRRGLTIDLGYAWCTLPSGREIGFVDVPGHERFIANMLAGVGPVPLVLFVVAADEGWRRQSEEHLQILDVLGVSQAVVALTKRDLVDDETATLRLEEIRGRLGGSGLEGAPIVEVSTLRGTGLDRLRAELDAMFDRAPEPEVSRARLFVDRVFTIKGAGTVVTGTLTGNCLEVGDDVQLLPRGIRSRVRSLQTHRTAEDRACPVSRVAANLAGTEREGLARGDVLVRPGRWRPTRMLEARVRPVRGLAHALTGRGAFKLYAGAAEVDATVRILGATSVEAGNEGYARIRLSRPLVLDVFDRFVLRDAGRRETVAGGIVLDPAPPPRPGPDPAARLADRMAVGSTTSRTDLVPLLVAERGAVKAGEAAMLTGAEMTGTTTDAWLLDGAVRRASDEAVLGMIAAHHAAHPLERGAGLEAVRATAADALRRSGAPAAAGVVESVLSRLESSAAIAREAGSVRLADHRVALQERRDEVDRMLALIGGERETTPPTVRELGTDGIPREVIDAAEHEGLVVRLSADLIVTPAFAERAEAVARSATTGITVSAFREAIATSRKYAVPMLEWLDRRGVTRREGDLRYPRASDRAEGRPQKP